MAIALKVKLNERRSLKRILWHLTEHLPNEGTLYASHNGGSQLRVSMEEAVAKSIILLGTMRNAIMSPNRAALIDRLTVCTSASGRIIRHANQRTLRQ